MGRHPAAHDRHRQSQGSHDLESQADAAGVLASFQLPHEAHADVGQLGELFLRQPLALALGANRCSERCTIVYDGHFRPLRDDFSMGGTGVAKKS